MLLALGSIYAPSALAAPKGAAYRDALVAQINLVRVANGLSAVASSASLQRVAADYSGKLAAIGRITHDAPNALPFSERMKASGYSGRYFGETLAVGYTAARTVRAWLRSAPHREALLSSRYRSVGVGVVRARWNGQLAWYVTANWGG